ncbi:MAG: hypothetical protein KJ739_02760, partial [Nitrospinae bacterium]|nr:hypothetical protein [Nitrospinota bacterium]
EFCVVAECHCYVRGIFTYCYYPIIDSQSQRNIVIFLSIGGFIVKENIGNDVTILKCHRLLLF